MVLAAALHQVRHDAIVYRDGHDPTGVYLFAEEFPEYDRRMEVIAFLTRMRMEWEDEFTLG